MKKLAIALMLFGLAAATTAAPKWVEIDRDDYAASFVDASSFGKLADGRVLYWLKNVADYTRSPEGKYFTYLYTAKCGSATDFEVQAARAYDDNKLTYTDATPKRSEGGTKVPDGTSTSERALAYVCDRLRRNN